MASVPAPSTLTGEGWDGGEEETLIFIDSMSPTTLKQRPSLDSDVIWWYI